MIAISNTLNIVTHASGFFKSYNYAEWQQVNQTIQNAQDSGTLGRLFPAHIFDNRFNVLESDANEKFQVLKIKTMHLFADLQWYTNEADLKNKTILETQDELIRKTGEYFYNVRKALRHYEQNGIKLISWKGETFPNMPPQRLVSYWVDCVWEVKICWDIHPYVLPEFSDLTTIDKDDFERTGY